MDGIVSVFTAGLLLSVGAVLSASACPSGWILHGDYCYQLRGLRTNDARSWAASSGSCHGDLSYLLSIHSTSEQNFVVNMLRMNASNVDSVYIGLNSRASASGYHWSDHSPVSYTHWKRGFVTETGMDCIAMDTSTGYWDGRFCDDVTGYVCKKLSQSSTVSSPSPAPPTTVAKHCKSGWKQYGSYCYLLSGSDKATYDKARQKCQQTGAELVSINSIFEQAFVISMLQDSRNVWIGLNDKTMEGVYVWTDSKPVIYTNWGSGEPNSNSSEDDCVTLISARGEWNDMPCTHVHSYICKTIADQTTKPSQSVSHCPSDWLSYNSHCYLFTSGNSTTGKSFSEAEKDCVSKGSHLVHIDDFHENAFVVMALPLYAHPSSSYNWMWIGLNDIQTEGLYEYTDGSPVTFTSWRQDQPDDYLHAEDCGHIYAYPAEHLGNGMWNDLSCTARQGWICERREDAAPPTNPSHPTTMSPKQCQSGWARFHNFCYNFNIPLRLGWTAARDRCLMYGADLVSMHSTDERQFVVTQAQIVNWRHSLWTGLNDRNIEGGYAWSDGSPVQFTNWGTSQPDNWKGLEDCIEMYIGARGLWNDLTCSEIRHFACKVAVGSPVLVPAVTLSPSYEHPCDDGWVGHGPYCYLFTGKEESNQKTWPDAVTACQQEEANLTSITSLNEEEFISNYIRDLNDTSFTYRMWIGLNDRDKEGNFVWVDGSAMSFTYWNTGEPNNWQCFEDCGDLVYGQYWNDNQCTKTFPYICKKLRRGIHVSNSALPQPSTYGYCSDGWIPAGGYCYLVNRTALTWPAAQSFCSSIGADLTSIATPQESTDLWFKVLPTARVSGRVWIGLNDRLNEHQYVWTDGSPVQVIAWDRGQPNDFGGVENCVYFNRGNARWHDANCDAKLPFICKTKKVPYPSTAPPVNGTPISCTTTFSSCSLCSKVSCPAGCSTKSASIWGWQIYTSDSSICLAAIHSGFITGQGGTVQVVSVLDHGVYPSYKANGVLSKSHGPADRSFTVQSTSQNHCDPGWILHKQSCYLVVASTTQSATPQSDAQQMCKMGGGQLVVITDHFEQAFLMSQLPAIAGNVWIGLTVTGTSKYEWNGNERYDYSFWVPRSSSDGNNAYCVSMNAMGTDNAGMWQESNCNTLKGYVCEKALNGSSAINFIHTSTSSTGGLSGGAVAGIVLAIVVIISAFVIPVVIVRIRRKRSVSQSVRSYRHLKTDADDENADVNQDLLHTDASNDDDDLPIKLDG